MISILYVNACGDKNSNMRLNFKGDHNARALLLGKLALNHDCNIIYVNDWAPVGMSALDHVLQMSGYSRYFPEGFEKEQKPWRFSAVSTLFVKDVLFKQLHRPVGAFDTTYRYIMGKITKEDITLVIKGNHIPPADENALEVTENRKRRMLLDDIRFMHEVDEKGECAIAVGDYNGNRGDYNYVCQEELNLISWHDVLQEPTYDGKQLDHVFVSPVLAEKNVVSAEAIEEGYMQLTDHKIIKIMIEAKQK